jgi:phosphoglycerate dehydrogenase-like enzyme
MNEAAHHKVVIILHDEFDMWQPPAWFAPRLRTEFPQVEVAQPTSKRQDELELANADVMLGWSLRSDELRAAPRLRWIYSITAAVDRFMSPELIASDVVICNAGRVHGAVVAEHAIAMIMALAKRVPAAVRYQDRRKWGRDAIWNERPRPREVRGSMMALVGLGSIGMEIVAMASALKMHVIGVREHPERGSEGAHEVMGYDSLDAAIARADFIVLAAPETARTRNLIDERRLRLFRPDAYLINVARGSLVDEVALVAALRNRQLAGAALDVFSEEPLPRRSRLWKIPQVLITPHTAFLTEKVWERHYALFADNLRRYFAGQPLIELIDKTKGY